MFPQDLWISSTNEIVYSCGTKTEGPTQTGVIEYRQKKKRPTESKDLTGMEE